MTIDRNHFFRKFFIFVAGLGFSFLLCSLALATSTEQLDNADGNWVFINGEDIIDAPLSIVKDHFKDIKKADSMVPGLKVKKILEQVSESERIDYDHYELPWPFKDRYTIYRSREKTVAGQETLITVNSIPNYPFEDKDKIIMQIKNSRFLLKSLPDDATKTRVTIEMTLDPGGFLPVWFLNLQAKQWSKGFFKNLRKNVRRELSRKKVSQANLIRHMKTAQSSSY